MKRVRDRLGRLVSCMLSFVLLAGPVLGQVSPAHASEVPVVPLEVGSATFEPSVESSPTVVEEDLSRRTETSKHYLLSDGTYEAVVWEGPVHVEDGQGAWRDIDTRLLLDVDDTHVSAATAVEVRVGAQEPGRAPVTLRGEGWQATLDLLGVAERSRVVLGDRVRYLDVAPDTSLEYQVLSDGLKETLYLRSAAAPANFTFELAAEGLSPVRLAGGQWSLADAQGTRVLDIGGLTVFDSSIAGPDGAPAYCADAVMEVEPVAGGARVTYRVDPDWLADPARVFPVMVDPTLTLAAGRDTYIASATPTTSYSAAPELRAGYRDSASGHQRSLLFFDVSSIPAGSHIGSAKLSVYQFNQYPAGTDATPTYFGRATSDWSNATTWNTRPSHVNIGTQMVPYWSTWVHQYVEPAVRGWVAGTVTNRGFTIYQKEDGTQNSGHYRRFCSREHENTSLRPKLVVSYETPVASVSGYVPVTRIGDVLSATMTVATAHPDQVREMRMLVNYTAGDAARYRGYFGWFTYHPGGGWEVREVGDGTYLAHTITAFGGSFVDPVFSDWEVSVSPGQGRSVTFRWKAKDSYEDVQRNDLDTYFEMGDAQGWTWRSGWVNQDTNVDIAPAAVASVSATATAGSWAREVDEDGDGLADRTEGQGPDAGRGSAALSWPRAAGALGYRVMLFDGAAYREVGRTLGNTSTSWSSADAGICPSDDAIAEMEQDTTANPYQGAASPSPASEQTSLDTGLGGSGLVLAGGEYLYVHSWSTAHPGPRTWTRVGTGHGGTTAGQTYGTIGTDSGRSFLSAFLLDGVIYDGYATSVTTLEGASIEDTAGTEPRRTLTLSVPPIRRHTGAPITAATGELMVASDGEHIYSAGYDRAGASDTFTVRVYDAEGTHVADKSVLLEGQTPYANLGGMLVAGEHLYLYEWTNDTAARVTKVSMRTWTVTGQWVMTDQVTTRAVNGSYDAASNVFWLGGIDSGTVRRYAGTGLDLRDRAGALYAKTPGTESDARDDWAWRIWPYNSSTEADL
ncbi:MAG: DNRLRE domain-containing protein, partial [Coriobacteriia bacterium]|nr:DNRLRE domain-containing protein [Coriobacteriia bacterium]